MSTQAPTPETEAFKHTVGVPWHDFASKLERERDEAIEAADFIQAREAELVAKFCYQKGLVAEKDAQIVALRSALVQLRDAPWLNMPGRANDIVETALSTSPPIINPSPFHDIQAIQEVQREGWMPEAPPAVVPLEDVRPLIEAIEGLLAAAYPATEQFAKKALSAFTAKHAL